MSVQYNCVFYEQRGRLAIPGRMRQEYKSTTIVLTFVYYILPAELGPLLLCEVVLFSFLAMLNLDDTEPKLKYILYNNIV